METTMNERANLQLPKEHRLSHSMVHYLLTIHRLKEEKGYARVTDIAKSLGLTKGSVSTALNNLKKRGLVEEEIDSKFLFLSSEGHEEVHQILSSRKLLFYFLRDVLGVHEEWAHKDSCYMEHLLHQQTRQKFFDFMKKYSTSKKINEIGTVPCFQTTLDLSKYQNVSEFEREQEA